MSNRMYEDTVQLMIDENRHVEMSKLVDGNGYVINWRTREENSHMYTTSTVRLSEQAVTATFKAYMKLNGIV